MTSAWGFGWGVAWGNSWGAIAAGATPSDTVLTRGGRKHGTVSHNLSRKRFEDELKNLFEASRAALARAENVKTGAAAEALEKAARAADEAAEAARDDQAADVTRLVALLESAARAQETTAIIRQARLAIELAAIMAKAAEDEEEAIMLLLS